MALILYGDKEIGGGFQQQLTTILKLKNLKKYRFSVFVFSKENKSRLLLHDVESIHHKLRFYDKVFRYLLQQNWAYFLSSKFKIMSFFEKTLNKYNIDLVYFLSPNGLSLDLVNHNYIITVWDICHRDTPEFPEVRSFKKFERREFLYINSLKKAIAVITDSRKGKNNLIRRYGLDEDRIFPVPFLPSENSKNNNTINVKNKYGIETSYIYYPAQFWPHKNHVYIIDAISILLKENIVITAVFSGSDQGNLNYVIKYAENMGVKNQIKYIGFVPGEDIYSLYKQSLALVMPTYFGPTNIPPLEAFAIGVPVIYSDLPSLRDQVGDAVLLCDLNKPESLVNHIKSLLQSDNFRSSLIKKGQLRLMELQQVNIAKVAEIIFDEYAVKMKSWKS